jgi:rhodanese-related sulfurtransferase
MTAPTRRFHLRSAARRSQARIDPDRARELTEAGAVVIDVRRREDASVSPPGALRIAPDLIPEHLETLRSEVAIVLACT